jgi:hypothetical protein
MDEHDAGSETRKERIDRELGELLDEVRVALPGAQVLLAFLLGIAFTERATSLSSLQQATYFATLLLVAAGTALLITPTAYHRLNFRDGGKEELLHLATRLVIASLGLLVLTVTGVVFLVTDLIYGTPAAVIAAACTCSWFLLFWLAIPISHRSRRGPSPSGGLATGGSGNDPGPLRRGGPEMGRRTDQDTSRTVGDRLAPPTTPDKRAIKADRAALAASHEAGPGPTPEEEAAADRTAGSAHAGVVEHYEEMIERGAAQEGEGRPGV